MKKLLWAAILLLIPTLLFPIYGQPAQTATEKLDEYLLSAHRAFRFNGTALIAHKGKILLHKAYGVRTPNRNRPTIPALASRFCLSPSRSRLRSY
jgi:hypothetical protein